MRRLTPYIHQLSNWPQFKWNHEKLAMPLAELRHHQGKLIGRMENLGFHLRSEAMLQTLTLDILKSSEIEGEILNPDQVRSSVARRLGMDIAGLIPADRNVEGVVEMMVDATQQYDRSLTAKRLFNWHAALFPTARNGMQKIVVGAWRNNTAGDPMQVISGAMGKEKIHFEAPASAILPKEMKSFLHWFNNTTDTDPVIKAAIAHLWFVTIHPFDDGNGRIARAITDMQLSRADGNAQRFYSMSVQIRKDRNTYYEILETTQKGNLDITLWIQWCLTCLERALIEVDQTLGAVLYKARFWEQNNSTILNERQKEMLNKLLHQFEGKLTTSKWAKMAKCSQDTALRDIQDLVGKNILVKEESGGRSTGYVLNG
jgi:Fic family protein